MIEPKSERNWVLIWAAVIVMLSSVPYIWGWAITPTGYHFLGLTHNIDDGAVYLSWMRQAADGEFFIRNLYTLEPQPDMQFNVLFLVMGWFAAVTRLPLVWVFHIFRVGLGIALIWAIWRFSKLFLEDANERRILIPLIGLSAGLGWLIRGRSPVGSVDTWQPEAITFLSIYLNPLFLAGLILMVAALYWLVTAHRNGRAANAVYAGLALLLLGNVHTYDVLTVACVWAAYLVVDAIAARRLPVRTLGFSALAAAIAVPSIAYQFYVYVSDPVFSARVNTLIPSPPIVSFLAGYGLVLLGAVAGALITLRSRSLNTQHSTLNTAFLLVWSVVGFALPYVPVAQQRKLIMGLHIPLCMLCAIALSRLLSRAPRKVAHGVLLAFILFTAGSNVEFMTLDMLRLSGEPPRTATHYVPYLSDSEMAALGYLREHTGSNDGVLAPPTFSLFTPALAARPVYYGHFSETPDHDARFAEWIEIANEPDPSIAATMIAATGARRYVVTPESLPWIRPSPTGPERPPLKALFHEDDVWVYGIHNELR